MVINKVHSYDDNSSFLKGSLVSIGHFGSCLSTLYARLPSAPFWRVPSLEPFDFDSPDTRASPSTGKHVAYGGDPAKGR
jgi:hypothetical protein